MWGKGIQCKSDLNYYGVPQNFAELEGKPKGNT
jgi:hypothetical protein